MVRAAVIVDSRANAAQKDALVAFVRQISGGLIDEIVNVSAAPVTFESDGHEVRVAAADAKLAVRVICTTTQLRRDAVVPSAGCGQRSVHGAHGINTFSGKALGVRAGAIPTGAPALSARSRSDKLGGVGINFSFCSRATLPVSETEIYPDPDFLTYSSRAGSPRPAVLYGVLTCHRFVHVSPLQLAAALFVMSAAAATAQDLAVEKGSSAPPAEVAQPIAALLSADSTKVMRGANALEFWWVKTLPLKAAPASAASWADVPDGALVGVVTLAKPMTDIRGLR